MATNSESSPTDLTLEEMNDIYLEMGTEVRIINGVAQRIRHTRSLLVRQATDADRAYVEALDDLIQDIKDETRAQPWAPRVLRAMEGTDEAFEVAFEEFQANRES